MLVAHATALVAVDFGEPEDRIWQLLRGRFGASSPSAADRSPGRRLGPAGLSRRRLDALDTLPVDAGGTPFQREVWTALRAIPAGTTWSYKRLADRIARPAAVRAVGLANGANPLGIVVPCHRVIGADGSLTGYGGGLARKRWLLEHEGALLPVGA